MAEKLTESITFKVTYEEKHDLEAIAKAEKTDVSKLSRAYMKAKIQEVKPDIVLLDIMMPKLDGIGVVWEMKSHEDIAHTPVVMLTNLSDPATISKILEAGVTDYLLKSEQSIDQIVDKAKEVLARSGK